MGYKQMDNNLTFTDLSLFNSMERNRSVSRMEKINAIINWPRIESLLLTHYAVGKSAEGIAIDARLVQSVSHPLSKEKLEEAKAKSPRIATQLKHYILQNKPLK